MDSAVKWENVNIFTVLSNGLATILRDLTCKFKYYIGIDV